MASLRDTPLSKDISGNLAYTTCRCCETGEETPRYLLVDCEAVAIKRTRTLGRYELEAEELTSLKPLQVLKFVAVMGV